MLGLVPAELWDYRLTDLGRGIATALSRKKPNTTLSIPGLGSCIPARSARAALVTALEALELPPGSGVAVPLYCCHVVFKAIEAAGCQPRFIDVDPATFCMSAADLHRKSSQVGAVIAVHMFGNVCDISALREAVGGKPIIEDCALSVGSKLGGHFAGSAGDIAVFSFRSGKYLSVGEGGALTCKDPEVRTRILKLIAALPLPHRIQELVHIGKTYLRSALRSEPLYGLIGYGLWERYNRNVEFSDKAAIVQSRPFSADIVLAIERLKQLDAAITRQRANADYYLDHLEVDKRMLSAEPPGAFYNRYQFPVTFASPEERDFVATHLFKRRIEVLKPLQHVVEGARESYGYSGDCPVAERLSQTVLVIPNHYRLRRVDVQRIGRYVNRAVRKLPLGTVSETSGGIGVNPSGQQVTTVSGS